MKNWRYLIVIGFLVAVFLGLTLVSTVVTKPPSDSDETITNRSVFNGKPSGYRAWHATLMEAGIPVTIWRSNFNTLSEMPPHSMMVLIEPYTAAGVEQVFGEEQAMQLLDWVEEGNRVVLIDDFRRTGSKAILSELDVYLARIKKSGRSKPEKPVFHEIQIKGIPHVSQKVLTEVDTFFDATRLPKNAAPRGFLSENPLKWAFMDIPYGEGYILLGTPVDLADNSFLQNRDVDNYQFLAGQILNFANGREIVINEYVHGYTRAGDLLTYYQTHTPLGKVMTQLILLFMAMLWLSFTPWKPRVSMQEEKHNISLMAFIESMAGIHFRSRAASVALAPALSAIEIALRKRYRMGLNEPQRVRALLEGLFAQHSAKEYSGKGAEQMQALEKARQVVARRQSLPHQEVLKLSQQLSLIQETLQHGSRTKN